MKLPLKQPMIFMSRVDGPRGVVRELSSIFDPNFAYSVILSRDAIDLGYPEASYKPPDWQKIRSDLTPNVMAFRGLERSVLVKLKKVSVGKLSATDVEALVLELDLARMLPVDLILGGTFLKNFRLEVDMKNGYVSLT